jgi:hypothetical protein
VRNVLNTLFIPERGTNEYRYRYRAGKESNPNINPADLEELIHLSGGTSAVIVFVDRFGDDGYFYHPLRMARTVLQRKRDDYLFFRVELDDFIYPRDLNHFQGVFTTHMHPKGIVQLTDDDPLNKSDGWYAVSSNNLFTQRDDFFHGDRAWSRCVDWIKDCKSFSQDFNTRPSDKNDFVFMRCGIRKGSGSDVSSEMTNNETVFNLTKGEQYELDLTYRYPSQLTNAESSARVSINIGDSLKNLSPNTLNIDSATNSLIYRFTTKRYIEEPKDSISFEFLSPDASTRVYGSDSKLTFKIQESTSFWFQLALALLVFSLSGVYIGADFTDIDSFRSGVTTLWDEVLAGFIQACVLFWLFRLVGKRII